MVTLCAFAVLTLGICALEAVPDGVRARGCGGAGLWTVNAEPALRAASGAKGGVFGSLVVDVALRHGDSLWMGVSERRDGVVRPGGLVRHDVRHGATHAFRGTDAGPCGFRVHDLLLQDETLWVATDLGISRLRLSAEVWDEWAHYALSADHTRLEEATCASLLAVAAEAAALPGGEEIGAWLAEFRPRFWKKYRRGMRNASR